MKKALFLIVALLIPLTSFAGSGSNPRTRGFTKRDWRPRGQMQGEENYVRDKLRDLRLQEERRPSDIQAPASEMEDPGNARPTSKLSYKREQAKKVSFYGGGFQNIPFYGAGWGLFSEYDLDDPASRMIGGEEPPTEWWEMNERSTSQRGGWFNTRYQSKQPSTTQTPGQAGQIGPPTGGGATAVTPGRNMPEGGGGEGHH